MSKKLSIFLIILLFVFIIALSVFLGLAIKNDYKFQNFNIIFKDHFSKNLLDEKEFNNIKDLNINVESADIIVETNSTNTIKVEIYSDNAKEYSITENDKINVVLKNKKIGWFMFGRKGPYVKVLVPSNYSNNINIISKTGDIKIDNLPNASLTVNASVGDIKVKNINNADINCTTGDIKIDEVKELTIIAKTGDVRIIDVNDITVKVKTGDIRVNNINNSLNLESNTGDIRIENANININSKIKSDVGDIKLKNARGCYIDTQTKVGDIKVNNLDRKSDIILTIISRVGDIKVNY